jgi:hypothetical protein
MGRSTRNDVGRRCDEGQEATARSLVAGTHRLSPDWMVLRPPWFVSAALQVRRPGRSAVKLCPQLGRVTSLLCCVLPWLAGN